MSRFSPIYVAFLVALLIPTVASASTKITKSISKRRNFIQKLNLFMAYVDQGFQSVASNMKVLRDLHKEENQIDSRVIENLNSSIHVLKSLEPVCLEGWLKYGASCFLFITGKKGYTAQTVKEICEKKHGHLAKCTSPEQQQFFQRSVKAGTTWIIIGGNKRDKDGTWRWPDGSLIKSSYTNWQPGYPRQNHDCMYISASRKTWSSTSCAGSYSPVHQAVYVCEMPTSFY